MNSRFFLSFIFICIVSLNATFANKLTRERIDKIDFEQRLGQNLPGDLYFTDHTGSIIRLGDLIGNKPVILSLVYFECPTLCNQVLNSLLRALNVLTFNIGTDFDVVTVSIDPKESFSLAAEKRTSYLSKYRGDQGQLGWSFLTGEQSQIDLLADSVGFRYEYDAESDQYIHASGIMVITPDGKIANYLYGLDYAARDLRLGLVEASERKIGSPIDKLLLLCYAYDPLTGGYGLIIMNALRIGSLLAMISLGTFVFVMLRRDRQKNVSMSTKQMEPR